MIAGQSMSCGCIKAELTGNLWKHGGYKTREYHSWQKAKYRCHSPNDTNYRNYGARGIQMCERWRTSFPNFLADMGPQPSNRHSLDRIDNAGNYEPGNCRWATFHQQSRNSRRNIWLTHNGETLTMTDWASRAGFGFKTFQARINAGWSMERALTQKSLRDHG